MNLHRSLLGPPNTRTNQHRHDGGILPSIRTTYTPEQRQALAALAESRPDPETYAREKRRILEANR